MHRAGKPAPEVAPAHKRIVRAEERKRWDAAEGIPISDAAPASVAAINSVGGTATVSTVLSLSRAAARHMYVYTHYVIPSLNQKHLTSHHLRPLAPNRTLRV
eukprot:GHVU01009876.1.p2 GENE.GHVU01009876.1~~GHVU01009876.1.p2  ORF type:complete len:102 (-),score=5.97 GHVU01009876.1:809-1114(-)